MIYNPAYETAEYEQITFLQKGKQGYHLLINRRGNDGILHPEIHKAENFMSDCMVVASQEILDQLPDACLKTAEMCTRYNFVDGEYRFVPRYIDTPFTEILDGIKNHLWKPASDHKVTHED